MSATARTVADGLGPRGLSCLGDRAVGAGVRTARTYRLVGFLNSFRMIRLPDPVPVADIDGLALG